MSRLLFLVNHLTGGVYTCHARIEFASAQEQQTFLEREQPSDTNGWHISVSSPDRKGYDGKPVYQTDVRLSTPYPRLASQAHTDQTDRLEEIREDHADYGRHHTQQDGLTWQEQFTFQNETADLLDRMGVTDLGWRRKR
jgi:hypothetical protein